MHYEPPPNPERQDTLDGITRLSVAGFKSIDQERSIQIRPLTVLAGANSSGKSSMMQPLLLLKQTLDVPYDPGVLWLDGPDVRFTSANQIFSARSSRSQADAFTIDVTAYGTMGFAASFSYDGHKGIQLAGLTGHDEHDSYPLRPDMTAAQIAAILDRLRRYGYTLPEDPGNKLEWTVELNRFLLSLRVQGQSGTGLLVAGVYNPPGINIANSIIRGIIHVPGLRGNPERTYPRTSVNGPEFTGTFESYVASVIAQWQVTHDRRLDDLSEALNTLGLAWKVDARQIDDAHVELRVARLPRRSKGASRDMISIADVGFGVSQTLPVLVALLAAERGHLVYLEQPEIHLHPRAQTALARILFDAAQRGVRVVVETHSSLLLLGIQTLVAEGRPHDLVKLHWFTRDSVTGMTSVSSTDLDGNGAFDTNWPEDFAEVALIAESRYLNAAEARLARGMA